MSTRPQSAICAPATPLLPSAVGLVRVSGANLAATLAPLLVLPEPRRASLCTLRWDGLLPIHAIGVGEKIDDLRPFDPDLVARVIAGVA